MESLDFVIDLTESLEKQNIDYFLVALRKNDEGSKADVFYRMSDERSVKNMCHVLDTIQDDIEIESEEKPVLPARRAPEKRVKKKAAPKRKQNNKRAIKPKSKPKPKTKPSQGRKPTRKRGKPKRNDGK